MKINKVNILKKYDSLSDHWSPAIIGSSNGQLIKIARLKGEFIWHNHTDEDELFLVLEGVLHIEFRTHTETLHAGEMLVVPKGVGHKPYTNGEEVKVVLIEPASTKHTGAVESKITKNDQPWI